MAEKEKIATKEKAEAEVKVGAEKVKILQEHLEASKISGFGIQDFENEVHAQAFRSNLPVAGQNLPFMILLDDSVYTICLLYTSRCV